MKTPAPKKPQRKTPPYRFNVELADFAELDVAIAAYNCCNYAGIMIEHVGRRGKPSKHRTPYKVVLRGYGEEEARQLSSIASRAKFRRTKVRVIVASDDESSAAGAAVVFLMMAGWPKEKALRHITEQSVAPPSRRLVRAGLKHLAASSG